MTAPRDDALRDDALRELQWEYLTGVPGRLEELRDDIAAFRALIPISCSRRSSCAPSAAGGSAS